MPDKISTTVDPANARKREIAGWAMYDVANSGYTTVVLTTIYSAFFVAVVAGGESTGSSGTATLLWTLAIAGANLAVLLCAPVIGAIADYRAHKKLFLFTSTLTCIISTALLALAGREKWCWQ